MDVKKVKKTEREEILTLAENTKYYTDLLIQQSDSWLTFQIYLIPALYTVICAYVSPGLNTVDGNWGLFGESG